MIPLQIRDGLTLYHVGPPLENGPLPSIFYFALSASDSLTKDPFNQPIQFLSDRPIRFFSLDLPAHEGDQSPFDALNSWAQDISNGIDVLTPFFEKVLEAIQYGIDQTLIHPEKLGIAGLSRGGFLASHLAAREPRIKAILQFAPLTNLKKSKDLHSVAHHPLVEALNLFPLACNLSNRNIRFYIGNKDTRVDTRSCFEFAMHLVDNSTLRSPQIELIITPSIGQAGHGTSPDTFKQGAEWLANAIS